MPPRKKKATKTPSVYEGKWTPLFEDVPTGMSVVDRAVYGFIVRMEQMDSKKSTAAATTIGTAIGASEKTVDRTLARLMEWRVIRRTYNGGNGKGDASHYVSRPRKEWDEETISKIAEAKAETKKRNRVNLSGKRDKLSNEAGQSVQEEGHPGPGRDDKRVSIRDPKRDVPTRKSKKEKKRSSPPAQTSLSPDANNHPKGDYPQSEFILPNGAIDAAALRKAFDATGLSSKEYGAWVNSQLGN